MIKRLCDNSTGGLLDTPLAPHLDAYTDFLTERRYSAHTVQFYLAGIAHFSRWASGCQLDIHQIDEEVTRRFLDDHLPHCDCPNPVHRVRKDLHAALSHLLVVLRARGVIAEPSVAMTPTDEELRRFDDYMNLARGLAPTTRCQCRRTVGRLLREQFGERPVVIAAITPEELRQFVARQSERYRTPASLAAVVSALRGYFRFRTACGDAVHGLVGVLSHPANWQLASLPKALRNDEVERLLGALDYDGLSARRSKAIVRCALDLGLRSSEIANLGLDDIDWQAGTVTLRQTKSRREDVLPLPAATGQAIADYLRFERPETTLRSVFVRRIAPRNQPIGPDLVRKAIRQAYARAGLPYTRSHLLRHTMASRLLEGGSALKEVADVLRHRSLNTTLIYAKLDGKKLAAVALPWPGCVS
jgi:integrase/recombinase XerC